LGKPTRRKNLATLLLSLKNGSLQIYTTDEETINTNTTYYQYSWNDYIQYGKTTIKLCKSGSRNPHTFIQRSACTSAWANTMHDVHSVQSELLTIKIPM